MILKTQEGQDHESDNHQKIQYSGKEKNFSHFLKKSRKKGNANKNYPKDYPKKYLFSINISFFPIQKRNINHKERK